MQLPPIATTTVGSFPRPGWLGRTDRSNVTSPLQGEALREAQDDATALILREQEQIGLDLVTDGEQRRTNFILHVVAGLDGFDFVDQRMKTIRRRTTGARPVPRVAGPVRRRGPIVVDDFRFARAHTDRPIKMAVPGPLTVIDSTYDDHYGDERALAMDIAAALNQELLELQAAGCDVVQIDEPAMTRYHEKTAEFAARALDRCLEGVTIPSIVHLCYGYPGGEEALQHEYQYPELLNVLMTTRIGGFSVEFARSGYDPAILRACKDRLVMFGCVDPGPVEESLGTVVGRVRSVLSHVDPGHLVLAPDCGLMTLSRDAARRKAGLLVAAAEMVRKEL